MPTNYKIEVHVKIVPSAEPTEEAPRQGEGDSWEWIVSEQTAESIDACEQVLLSVNTEAMRSVLAAHLTESSKKNLESSGKRRRMRSATISSRR